MIARAAVFHLCENCAHLIWTGQRAVAYDAAAGQPTAPLMVWRCLVCALRKKETQ